MINDELLKSTKLPKSDDHKHDSKNGFLLPQYYHHALKCNSFSSPVGLSGPT
jgi:hypothetical protein